MQLCKFTVGTVNHFRSQNHSGYWQKKIKLVLRACYTSWFSLKDTK